MEAGSLARKRAVVDDEVLGLADYLAVLSRRRWIVIGVVLLTVGAAVGISLLQTPLYEASAEIAVEPFRPAEDLSLQEAILGDVAVNTEQRVLTSRAVTDRVIADLGLATTPDDLLDEVSVRVIGDTHVLELRVLDPDPAQAAAIANGFATAYLDLRTEQAVNSLLDAQQSLEQLRGALRTELDAVEEQLANLDAAASTGEPDGDDPAPDEARRPELEAERDALQAQLALIATESLRAESQAGLVTGGGQVLNPADVPDTAVSPTPVRTGALALLLGLMLGVGLAFLRDQLDDIIRDEDDARRAGAPIPVVGRIPRIHRDGPLITLTEPASPQAEAFRGLSANVRFILAGDGTRTGVPVGDDDPAWPPTWPEVAVADRHGRSILVTSPQRADGKSSTAANLAVVAARSGRRVILVDADLRRPTIHRRLGLPGGVGMSDVIAGEASLADAVVGIGIDNLLVLPAGTIPPNPSELLSSMQTRALGRELSRGADLVIVDCPPVLAVADTLELAPHTDSVLLIVRAGVTRRRAMRHARERLDAVGASVRGLVVNDLQDSSSSSRYYEQGYPREARPERVEVSRGGRPGS